MILIISSTIALILICVWIDHGIMMMPSSSSWANHHNAFISSNSRSFSMVVPGTTTKWAPWSPPLKTTDLVVPWGLPPPTSTTRTTTTTKTDSNRSSNPSSFSSFSDKIAYVIMTSKATRDLHLWQRRTWLRSSGTTQKYVWAFSDESDGIFTMTLPSLQGKGTYNDAQHRQLRGMQWLKPRLPPNIEWIFMIDDDTWVNIPVLYNFLDWISSFAFFVSTPAPLAPVAKDNHY